MAPLNGVVKTFGGQKGYGFIKCDQVSRDVYFNIRELPEDYQFMDETQLRLQGVNVTFDLIKAPDGKPQAKNVQPLSSAGLGVSEQAQRQQQLLAQQHQQQEQMAQLQQLTAAMQLQIQSSAMTDPAHMQMQQFQLQQLQMQQMQMMAAMQHTAMAGTAVGSSDQQYAGEVKRFNEEKGYGFLGCPMLGADVYFQKRDVPGHLLGQQLIGQQATFTTHRTPDGKLQARNLEFTGGMAASPQVAAMQMFMPFAAAGQPAVSQTVPGVSPPDGSQLTGSIKNFDLVKGFGFVIVPGFGLDIYFKDMSSSWQQGQQVTFILQWMRDGKPQAKELKPCMTGGEVVVGQIKSYNDGKGFGFIESGETAQDIYFKKSQLPDDMQALSSSEVIGSEVRATVKVTGDGKPQAEDLMIISGVFDDTTAKREFPGDEGGHGGKRQRTLSSRSPAAAGQTVEGVVKMHNVEKGFGFISSDSADGDIYFKNAMMAVALQGKELAPGTQITFTLNFTPDGKPQGADIQLA